MKQKQENSFQHMTHKIITASIHQINYSELHIFILQISFPGMFSPGTMILLVQRPKQKAAHVRDGYANKGAKPGKSKMQNNNVTVEHV